PNLKGSSSAFSSTSTLPHSQVPHDGSSISSPTSSNSDTRSPTSDAVDHSLERIMNSENGDFINELQERDMSIAAFKKREMWLRAELALARKAGYTPEVDADVGVPDGIDIDNLMDISESAQIASQKITDSERVRTAALQEAAYFKAKLAALTNSSEHDLKILEVERATELEKRLTRALTEKEAVQNQLIQLQQNSNYDKNSREAAEERARMATSRAEEAEEAHARALAELATLHSRATNAESQHRETKSQLSELTLELNRNRGNSHNQIQSLQQSVEQHQRALEKANVAIAAANERASEAESLWRQARQDISNLEKEAAGLRSELDIKMRDLDRVGARAAEMERLLDKTRQERDAVRDMMKDGMTKLLNNSRPNEDLSVPTRVSSQVIHLEQEIETLKNMNAETKESAEKASISLANAMDKIVQLESALTKARSETAMLQRRLAESSDEVIRTKGRLREKERTLDEKTCALEDAEIKVGMMRDVMVERGILEDVTSQGTLASQYKELISKCEELEQRAQHEEDKRKLLEEELKRMNGRGLNQDSLSPKNENDSRETEKKLSETLQKLQEAQDKLVKAELNYNTATHYVQGTEKMLRRLKEELHRSKIDSENLQKQLKAAQERNEELEEKLSEVQNQVSVRKGVRESKLQEFTNKQLEVQAEEFGQEMTEVQQKMKDLIVQIDHAREEKKMLDISYEALRKEYKTMQKDHNALRQTNQALKEQLLLSTNKVEQLKKELDNSMALNEHLNQQLGDDSGRMGDNISSNGRSRHHERWDEQRGVLERQIAQLHETNKKLERENIDFEQKLHESENKISLLLDQMEHAVDNYRVIEDGIKSSPRDSNIIHSMTNKLDDELDALNRWGNMNYDDEYSDVGYINQKWNKLPNGMDNESRDQYEDMIAALEEVQKVAAANRK
ncbi:17133_t:CDS:2, partial [Racocetra persica]